MKKNKYQEKLRNKKVGGIKKNIFSIIILVIFFAIGMYGYRCFFEKVCDVPTLERFVRHNATITTSKGTIIAEVADTKSSRELGLSGRPSIKSDEGLLFVFDVPGRYGFWMKDMLFPLDILWVNENGIVVEVERGATPDSYPKIFMNASPASYVLEVNAGKAEEEGLYIGSKVKISK